jgi:hypothetical protein
MRDFPVIRMGQTPDSRLLSMKITAAHLKTQISALGRSGGPKIGLVISLVVGLFNPHVFENDYFILLILLLGILGVLIHDAHPAKNGAASAASDKESAALKTLKASAFLAERPAGE